MLHLRSVGNPSWQTILRVTWSPGSTFRLASVIGVPFAHSTWQLQSGGGLGLGSAKTSSGFTIVELGRGRVGVASDSAVASDGHGKPNRVAYQNSSRVRSICTCDRSASTLRRSASKTCQARAQRPSGCSGRSPVVRCRHCSTQSAHTEWVKFFRPCEAGWRSDSRSGGIVIELRLEAVADDRRRVVQNSEAEQPATEPKVEVFDAPHAHVRVEASKLIVKLAADRQAQPIKAGDSKNARPFSEADFNWASGSQPQSNVSSFK